MSGGAGGLLITPSDANVAKDAPGYNLTTIFEVLQSRGVDWNVFYSDLPFALVFTGIARDAQYTSRMFSIDTLASIARTGDLPSFAWIDPNFNDVPDGIGNASDDHPPGDVARGQHFISQVYNTLVNSPGWSKTLLIITYDEHGGFYDHVRPPGTPAHITDPPLAKDGVHDDDPSLRRLGVRVPAFVVSPWVEPGHVAKKLYDHTSILKTALLRFCGKPIPSMGARTENANDLGSILTRSTPLLPARFTAKLQPHAIKTVSNSPVGGIGATIRRRIIGM
jgi:phospholipase C